MLIFNIRYIVSKLILVYILSCPIQCIGQDTSFNYLVFSFNSEFLHDSIVIVIDDTINYSIVMGKDEDSVRRKDSYQLNFYERQEFRLRQNLERVKYSIQVYAFDYESEGNKIIRNLETNIYNNTYQRTCIKIIEGSLFNLVFFNAVDFTFKYKPKIHKKNDRETLIEVSQVKIDRIKKEEVLTNYLKISY